MKAVQAFTIVIIVIVGMSMIFALAGTIIRSRDRLLTALEESESRAIERHQALQWRQTTESNTLLEVSPTAHSKYIDMSTVELLAIVALEEDVALIKEHLGIEIVEIPAQPAYKQVIEVE